MAAADSDAIASGARFCYLLINLLPNQKINTFIGESGNPFESVRDHNDPRKRASKSTKSAAPHWKLEMIVGEFGDQPSAVTFASSWANSRGIRSRRKRGHALAKLHGKTRYDRQYSPPPPPPEEAQAQAPADRTPADRTPADRTPADRTPTKARAGALQRKRKWLSAAEAIALAPEVHE